MRFMLIVKASKDSEAGVMPGKELIQEMGRFNEEMVNAGVMLAGDGLQASSKGARVKFSSGQTTVVDGPFAETKELIAGFWIIRVNSKEEAVAWARRCPAPHGEGADAEIEVRQLFDIEDFPAESVGPEEIAHQQKLTAEIERQKQQ